MIQNQMLLVDHCIDAGFIMELCESSDNGRVKFRGKFQEAEAINKNKRMYPFEILDENVKRLQHTIKERKLLGELDHPTDSIVHFANASHVVTKLWWEGKVLMGEGEILNTPHGKVLKALIHDGIPIGISSRGVGNGANNEAGVLVIGESYKLITFDAVADPSTHEAFQSKVVNAARTESVDPNRIIVNGNNSPRKNESTSIDTVSKEALIACLGSFARNQVSQYKARI
jgi:hypothetical protein